MLIDFDFHLCQKLEHHIASIEHNGYYYTFGHNHYSVSNNATYYYQHNHALSYMPESCNNAILHFRDMFYNSAYYGQETDWINVYFIPTINKVGINVYIEDRDENKCYKDFSDLIVYKNGQVVTRVDNTDSVTPYFECTIGDTFTVNTESVGNISSYIITNGVTVNNIGMLSSFTITDNDAFITLYTSALHSGGSIA